MRSATRTVALLVMMLLPTSGCAGGSASSSADITTVATVDNAPSDPMPSATAADDADESTAPTQSLAGRTRKLTCSSLVSTLPSEPPSMGDSDPYSDVAMLKSEDYWRCLYQTVPGDLTNTVFVEVYADRDGAVESLGDLEPVDICNEAGRFRDRDHSTLFARGADFSFKITWMQGQEMVPDEVAMTVARRTCELLSGSS